MSAGAGRDRRERLGSNLGGAGAAVPPDFGISRGIEHFREFLLDFAQAVGAQLEGGLVEGGGFRLLRALGIQVS